MITGIGVVSPLGANALSTWEGVLAGKTAARRLTSSDFSNLPPVMLTEEISWIGCPAAIDYHASVDRLVELSLRVTNEALQDAQLNLKSLQPDRVGCVFGTSKGSLFAATACLADPESPHPDWLQCLSGAGIGLQAILQHWGISGPGLAPVAACATGVAAVLRAADFLRSGECDLVIAGSADDSLHPLVLSSFQRLGVLANGPNPTQAGRPFDQNRNGFVMGAGAGALILERRSRATQRNRPWYAELGPGLLRSDPTGMTGLDATGKTLARLIRDCSRTSRDAEIQRPDVLNLHGTGTRMNDVAECRAVQLAYGEQSAEILCGSLKGSLGHLLGAAGSVELAICCQMLRDQVAPPNRNLDQPARDCGLCWSTGQDRRPIESLLKLSMGFGGHQAALWLNRGTLRSNRDDIPPSRS